MHARTLLGSMASTLLASSLALAQVPSVIPGKLPDTPAGPPGMASVSSPPVLLSQEPGVPPPGPPLQEVQLNGGTTGLRPGVDCLPQPCEVAEPRLYGEVAYMLTWLNAGPLPGPLAGAASSTANLQNPALVTLLGPQEIAFNGFNGARALAGLWLDRQSRYGVEIGGFLLERQSVLNAIAHTGANTPDLVRPYIDSTNGQLSALVVGAPGMPGAIASQASSQLWGFESNFAYNWKQSNQCRIDLLSGFLFYDLQESLAVLSGTELPSRFGPIRAGIADVVDADNQYYGWQIGTRTQITRGRLGLNLTGKVAVGFTDETVTRAGWTQTSGPGGMLIPRGFFTEFGQGGTVSTNQFAIALPTTITLTYQWTKCLSSYVGWDLVYISSVARPGDQIDLSINPGVAAAARTPPAIEHSALFANSIIFGLSMKY